MSPGPLPGFDVAQFFPSENGAGGHNVVLTGADRLDDTNNGASRNDSDQVEPQGQYRSNPDGVFQSRPDPTLSTSRNGLEIFPPSATLTRQLAELSISLEDHTSLFPPLSIHSLRPDQTPKVPYFSLDQTFHLTQSLIDLYPRFMNRFIHRVPTDLRRPPSNCFSTQGPSLEPAPNLTPNTNGLSSPELSQEHNPKTPSSFNGNRRTDNPTSVVISNPTPQRNDASILLILSCHHRLIDMWESIFSHISAMPAQSFGQQCLKFKLGSFVPSTSSSAVPMEIIMVVELMTQLLEHIQELVARMEDPVPISATNSTAAEESPKGSNGHGPEDRKSSDVDATVMASKLVLNRAKGLVEEIGRIRDAMQECRRERFL
ncbi:hypothetical protein MMC30_008132 [Trapelia coarctata]|nr:hypothetical protein [Trapelia coarctata]